MNRQKILSKITLSGSVLLFLATLLFWLSPISSGFTGELSIQDSIYRAEEFTIDTPGTLEVETSGGHIEVHGSDTDVVRVEMYVRRNGVELTPSDSDLDDFDIEISRSGNTVRAIAERENNRGWTLFGSNQNISISFIVYTPREMTTELHTSGGHIEVQQGEGELTLRTSGGHINLTDLSGTVEASTSGGHINARLNQVGEAVDLRTSGGSINITLPGETGYALDLRGTRVRTQLVNFTGTSEDNRVNGTINGGGPMISARTSGGSVEVRYE